jgi:hypothetical protein
MLIPELSDPWIISCRYIHRLEDILLGRNILRQKTKFRFSQMLRLTGIKVERK